jgi:peptidoglycan/xylan/chitin deacetylase (PgdA/CDA1 family)
VSVLRRATTLAAVLAAALLAGAAAAERPPPAGFGGSAGSAPLTLPAVLPARLRQVPILMYHLVGSLRAGAPPITRALTVPSLEFRREMDWISRHGFHAITQETLFDALELGEPLPPRPVLITFDDGYRDVLWNAAPVLERLHMHATDYVITGRISGRDPSFLTWPELADLQRLGIEIGSHTVHHVELPYLSRRAALAELVDSRRALERHLGRPVQWFAYPVGAVDRAVLPLVRKAGYVLAVTTRPGAVQSARDPLELHRYDILRTTTVAGLAALLGSAGPARSSDDSST